MSPPAVLWSAAFPPGMREMCRTLVSRAAIFWYNKGKFAPSQEAGRRRTVAINSAHLRAETCKEALLGGTQAQLPGPRERRHVRHPEALGARQREGIKTFVEWCWESDPRERAAACASAQRKRSVLLSLNLPRESDIYLVSI